MKQRSTEKPQKIRCSAKAAKAKTSLGILVLQEESD